MCMFSLLVFIDNAFGVLAFAFFTSWVLHVAGALNVLMKDAVTSWVYSGCLSLIPTCVSTELA